MKMDSVSPNLGVQGKTSLFSPIARGLFSLRLATSDTSTCQLVHQSQSWVPSTQSYAPLSSPGSAFFHPYLKC